MKSKFSVFLSGVLFITLCSCEQKKDETARDEVTKEKKEVTAKEILGNPDYQAISYGGYRQRSRETQPSLQELKGDMLIMSAMGIKVLRTYNVQLPHASNVLKAIRELKQENPAFEMYVMLGAWIDCKNAWTDEEPDHYAESEQNDSEIARAVELANTYPDIVKILAVGNEAMVKWATRYHVQASVILKWVNYLQELKKEGKLPAELWITSSDDFSSWGGADPLYHTQDLVDLMNAVDYISLHTYPYHNSHYNPEFWYVPAEEEGLSTREKVDAAMIRARDYAIAQFDSVASYARSVGVDKPLHIGETGWATVSDGLYGPEGSRATDEYKQGLYYQLMREWTDANGISCFYFEAFNEPWKDEKNPVGSENHFGLFTLRGKAKYPVWDFVDQGAFKGLTRDGYEITKTYDGDEEALLKDVLSPPVEPSAAVSN